MGLEHALGNSCSNDHRDFRLGLVDFDFMRQRLLPRYRKLLAVFRPYLALPFSDLVRGEESQAEASNIRTCEPALFHDGCVVSRHRS